MRQLWAVVAAVVAFVACTAGAQTHRWIGPSGGFWDDPANWDTGTVPGAASTVRFEQQGTWSVVLRANAAITDCYIDADDFTFNLGGFTLSLGAEPTPTGHLYMTRGTLRAQAGTLRIRGQFWSSANGLLSLPAGQQFIIEQGGRVETDQIDLRSPLNLMGGFLYVRGPWGSFRQSAPVSIGPGGQLWVSRDQVAGEVHVDGGQLGGGDHEGYALLITGNVLVTAGGHVTGDAIHTRPVHVVGTLVLDGEGTTLGAPAEVRGTLIVRHGALIAPWFEMLIRDGLLWVDSGAHVIARAYTEGSGTIRMEPDSEGPGLEGSVSQGSTHHFVIDGARTPRTNPRTSVYTNLLGSLKVTVVNPNGLRVGDEIILFAQAMAENINGAFQSFDAPALGGGRLITVVQEPRRVLLRIVPGGNPCWSADFNGDGMTGTDQDIEAFFACLGGDCCSLCGDADFNSDGDTGTDQDIEAFFRVLGGGSC